jgi:hypothetical protein
VVNPAKREPYAGPEGSVTGVITVHGDRPPLTKDRIPLTCGDALSTYERLFRAGPRGELADAIVGVTEYENVYIPAREEAAVVRIKGCAFDRRTVVMTFGQRLEILNTDDRESYLPHLEGARAPALLVAVPKGDAVRIYPPKMGLYQLTDNMMHTWLQADVMVLRYATATVSAIDGRYRIDHLPVGKMKISVRHPRIETVPGEKNFREIEIKAGEALEVNLDVTYKAPAPAPSAAPLPSIR